MTASAAIPFKKHLFTEMSSYAGLSTVTMYYGPPRVYEAESIIFFDTRSSIEFATMGNLARDEEITTDLVITVNHPSFSALESETRAQEILTAIGNFIHDESSASFTGLIWTRMGDVYAASDIDGGIATKLIVSIVSKVRLQR